MNLFRGQKVTKYKIIAASTRYVCVYMWREDTGTAMMFQRGCSFTLPPTDSMQVGGITIFLKLACILCHHIQYKYTT